MQSNTREPDIRWLILGAVVGLIIAGTGILKKSSIDSYLPPNSIARVNDHFISNEAYLSAVNRYQGDSRNIMNDEKKMWVLQRLIEEELLVQRGLSIGLAQSTNEIRGSIVTVLIESITADANAKQPSEEELQEYFENNKERFLSQIILAVEVWYSNSEISIDSFLLSQKNNSEKKETTIKRFDSMPRTLLPLGKIREYLGPSIANKLGDLPINSTTLHKIRGRWYVTKILDKQEPSIPPFETIKNKILNEYRRNLADNYLRTYIENLKKNSTIKIADTLASSE